MKPLVAESFTSDPRIAQARRLVMEALADYQQAITGIRAADPERKASYAESLRQFAAMRGGALFYPYLGTGIGKGALVELADGSVKYDMISGIGVHYFGHSHPQLVEAGFNAALSDTVMEGNLQQDTDSVAFSRLLIDAARRHGGNLEHCFLTATGATANENALKMVLQKHAPAQRILAFEHCFAGRTLALAQITDKAAYRVGLPTILSVDYVPFFDAFTAAESTARSLRALREHLTRFPKQHAAMMLELVQGEGGYYAGQRDFFVAIMDELQKHQIAIVIDEIQTFGRTSEPFAFQHFGLDAYVDVVTVGKLTQACATLFTDAYKPQPNLVSQTFTSSTAAIFAGRVIIESLLSGGYFGAEGKIERLRKHLIDGLEGIGLRHPGWVAGPYGMGAMIAFTAFDGGAERTKNILHALYEAGVIAFVAGSVPARIRFLMPVGAITPADIERVCKILESTLSQFA